MGRGRQVPTAQSPPAPSAPGPWGMEGRCCGGPRRGGRSATLPGGAGALARGLELVLCQGKDQAVRLSGPCVRGSPRLHSWCLCHCCHPSSTRVPPHTCVQGRQGHRLRGKVWPVLTGVLTQMGELGVCSMWCPSSSEGPGVARRFCSGKGASWAWEAVPLNQLMFLCPADLVTLCEPRHPLGTHVHHLL